MCDAPPCPGNARSAVPGSWHAQHSGHRRSPAAPVGVFVPPSRIPLIGRAEGGRPSGIRGHEEQLHMAPAPACEYFFRGGPDRGASFSHHPFCFRYVVSTLWPSPLLSSLPPPPAMMIGAGENAFTASSAPTTGTSTLIQGLAFLLGIDAVKLLLSRRTQQKKKKPAQAHAAHGRRTDRLCILFVSYRLQHLLFLANSPLFFRSAVSGCVIAM